MTLEVENNKKYYILQFFFTSFDNGLLINFINSGKTQIIEI